MISASRKKGEDFLASQEGIPEILDVLIALRG
jgi:hypothetical protein